MKTAVEFLFEPCRLRLYLWSVVTLASLLGLCGAPRYFRERKKEEGLLMRTGETIRSLIWDALVHLIGFLHLPTLLIFASAISDA